MMIEQPTSMRAWGGWVSWRKRRALRCYHGNAIEMKLQRLFVTNYHLLRLFSSLAVIGLIAHWALAWSGDPVSADGTPMACAVAFVLDGDTMDLFCSGRKVRVRLHCIDAPEMEQAPWGPASRDHLRIIAPRAVILIPKPTRYGYKDRFGRTVGELLIPDESRQNLNISQVFTGNAAVYPRYCRDDRYYWTEEVARSVKAGIWKKAGLQQSPWRTRH